MLQERQYDFMTSCFNKSGRIKLRLIFVVLTVCAFFASAGQDALAGRPQIKVLGIGNSFTGNAFELLRPIAQKCDQCELLIGQATIGGCSMEKHIRLAKLHEQDPDNPAGLPYWLSKTGKNGKRIRVRVGLKEILASETWDVVTIQQLSRESTELANYRPYARELYEYIKRYAPQAEVVLHQTWAYRIDGDFRNVFPGKPGYGQQEMHHDLTKAYNTIATELGVRVIPVGAAFQIARQRRPFVPDTTTDPSKLTPPNLPRQEHSLCAGWSWNLSVTPPKLRRDTHHAGVRGKYLAAAVWFEFLTGLNVRTQRVKVANVSDDDAQFLDQVAHDAIEQRAEAPVGAAR